MTAAPPAAINPKALATTIAVHALLLLLLALWKYTIPATEPQPQETGMEVNLGTSDNGYGVDQPGNPEDPAAAASRTRASSAAATLSNNVMQGNDPDNPEVASSNNQHKQNASDNNPLKRGTSDNSATGSHSQQQRPKFVMTGAQGRGGNSAMNAVPGGAEGNTQGNGDRGVPGGTPGAANYTGSPGRGTGGIGFSLSGREIVAFPAREAEFREGGKVVVNVTVDRAGAIVSSSIRSSTNAELNRLALRKIQSVRFNKSEQAPQEQFGTITFVFKAGQ